MNPVPLTWRLLTAEELTKVYLDEMRRDYFNILKTVSPEYR